MEEQDVKMITGHFCGQMKYFISRLHSNTTQLRASIMQKPPAYGDLSYFLLDFNDRLAENSGQIDSLEGMTADNVSFEELLAHCMELYQQNERRIGSLESHMEQLGYTKAGTVADGEERQALETSFVEGLKLRVRWKELSSRVATESREDVMATPNVQLLAVPTSSGLTHAQFDNIGSSAPRGRLESNVASYESPLPSALAQSKLDCDDLLRLGETFSLEDFGLSASSLASFVRRDDFPTDGKAEFTIGKVCSERRSDDTDESCGSFPVSSRVQKGSEHSAGFKSQDSLPFLSQLMNEEYDQLKPWLKQRVSLGELNEIVVKINDAFQSKQSETVKFADDDEKRLELEEIFLLGLGSNVKSCLFILVQVDKLAVTSHDSCTYYRPCDTAKLRC